MFFPFQSVDDTKKENITDINENICENEKRWSFTRSWVIKKGGGRWNKKIYFLIASDLQPTKELSVLMLKYEVREKIVWDHN